MDSTHLGVDRETETVCDELEIIAGKLDRSLLSSWRGIPSPMASAATTTKASAAKTHLVHLREINFLLPEPCVVAVSLACSSMTTSGSEIL